MLKAKVRPRIGLLVTGHRMYWEQFPELKGMGERMTNSLAERLSSIGEVKSIGLVDTWERAVEAEAYFKREGIDLLVIFPQGYSTGMMIAPVVRSAEVPIRLLNAHEDACYDYAHADTAIYLHHEGPCCIPEFAVTMATMNKRFEVISGHFGDEAMWRRIRRDALGAASATAFSSLRFGVIGNTYTGMTDMPTDEHRAGRPGRWWCAQRWRRWRKHTAR